VGTSLMLNMWIRQPTSNAPLARCAHAADCVDAKLYVFGGWSEAKVFNDLHVYDPGIGELL
jgi:N-acetylneuraminic acid mutarotase